MAPPMSEPVTLEGPVLVVGAGLLGTSIGLALRRRGVAVWFRDVLDREPPHRPGPRRRPAVPGHRAATAAGRGRRPSERDRGDPALGADPPPEGRRHRRRQHQDRTSRAAARLRAGRAVAVRRRAPDGGQRAVRAAGGQRGPVRRAPVGGHAAPGLQPARPSTWCSSWSRRSGRPPCSCRPTSTTGPSPGPRTSRTCSPAWSPAGWPRHRPGTWPSPGQGVRDVTRVAAGDPELWQQIVSGNAPAVVHLLGEVREQLDALIVAVSKGQQRRADADPGPGRGRHAGHPGQARRARCGPPRRSSSRCPTGPGELARLFADAGASGVNIEDVRIDHDPGRPTGLVELVVADDSAEHLLASLESRGWVTHR